MFLSKLFRAADHPYLEGHGGRKVKFISNVNLKNHSWFKFSGQQQPLHRDAGHNLEVPQAPHGPPAPVHHHGSRHRVRGLVLRKVKTQIRISKTPEWLFQTCIQDNWCQLVKERRWGYLRLLYQQVNSSPLSILCLVLMSNSRQFKWFNPRGVDYSNISDKRQAPNYKD